VVNDSSTRAHSSSLPPPHPSPPPPPDSEGSYVDVIAGLKSSGGSKVLNIFNTRLVTDLNQVTRHLLECIYSHLYATRGPIGGGPAPGGLGRLGGSPVALGAPGASSAASDTDIVLKFFQEHANQNPDDEVGMSINDVNRLAKTKNISTHRVQEIVNALALDGQLYSTVDDSHFKPTG
jgi:replication factor A2